MNKTRFHLLCQEIFFQQDQLHCIIIKCTKSLAKLVWILLQQEVVFLAGKGYLGVVFLGGKGDLGVVFLGGKRRFRNGSVGRKRMALSLQSHILVMT